MRYCKIKKNNPFVVALNQNYAQSRNFAHIYSVSVNKQINKSAAMGNIKKYLKASVVLAQTGRTIYERVAKSAQENGPPCGQKQLHKFAPNLITESSISTRYRHFLPFFRCRMSAYYRFMLEKKRERERENNSHNSFKE